MGWYYGPALIAVGMGIKWGINGYKKYAMRNMGAAGKAGASNIYNYPGGFQRSMTSMEAIKILGISASAKDDEIHKAWSRLIKINHPDMGGSSYITEKVNEAKEILGK